MKRRPWLALVAVLTALTIAVGLPAAAFADEGEGPLAVVEDTTGVVEAATNEDAGEEVATDDEGAVPVEDEWTGEDVPQGTASDDEVVPPDDADTPSEDSVDVSGQQGESADQDASAVDTSKEVPEDNAMQTATDEPVDDTIQAAEEPAETASDLKPADSSALTAQSGGVDAQAELDKLAKEHAGDLPAGRYAILSNADPATSGDTARYSLDVQGGSKASDAAIILYKAKVSNNQRWDVAYLSSGYATIRSVASGLYLALKGGADAFASGAAKVVQQKYQAGAAWQQWVIIKQDDGTFKIVSALLKNGTLQRTMDVRGGKAQNSAQAILYESKGSNDGNQRFSIVTTADILNAEAQQHKGDIKDGTYLLGSSLKNTYRINMRQGSMADGGKAIIYAGSTSAVNEGWDIVHSTNNYVYIINSKSGKALDVRGGKAKDGSAIIQWAKKACARNQLWICVKESNGSYKFVSALTGGVRFVLSVTGGKAVGGSAIDIEQDRGSADKAQHWVASVAPAQYAYAHAIKDGTYVIRTNLDQSKVLGVGDFSKKEQAQVKLWNNAQTNNQLWTLTHNNQGFVLLKNKFTGMYLAFSKDKVGGATVTAQSSTAGKWIVKPVSGSTFTLVDGATGGAVHLVSGSTANGAKVASAKATGGSYQKWDIVKGAALKIAIDPGHGADDSGAVGNGLRECDLNWRIAQACAEQLRSYGFDVYMTMTSAQFKNGGLSTPSIKDRVEKAYKAGCAAIFSMHINAADGSSAAGAEVLVPNSSSFHKEFYYQGLAFCSDVLARIKSGVGIANRGPLIRNYSASETGGENQYYSGGGYADYYGIVRYARLRGMFGVIIEHGFITNSRDASLINNNTTKLGQIDAAAIRALYYK